MGIGAYGSFRTVTATGLAWSGVPALASGEAECASQARARASAQVTEVPSRLVSRRGMPKFLRFGAAAL